MTLNQINFESLELDDVLVDALTEMGFAKPTSIQSAAIPAAMDGRDILASAPTGTGKTAAFVLPACQFLLDFPKQDCPASRILILTPTRELALQVQQQTEQICRFTDIRSAAIIGGINYGSDHQALDSAVEIIIATPGRLFEHIEQERFDCRELDWIILDEADRMLDMGFGGIVQQICAEARWRKQTLLFSATLNSPGVSRFAKLVLNEPQEVSANPSRKERPKILQSLYYADDLDHKRAILKALLQDEVVQRAVVFVKTRDRLDALRSWLQSQGINSVYLQGEMPQDKRIATLDTFKSGKVNILVATDVAARGIDIPDVSHVINYDMPRTADVFVHRIGRTGRTGKKGNAVAIVEAHDMEILQKVQRFTDELIKPKKIKGLEPKHKVAKVPSKKPKKKVKKKVAKTKRK
ncbi:MAG: ATP-dependent RNA helicase SrmB [Aestuariibacter sp.]